MGTVSSQTGQSKLNVQNESDPIYKTKIGKQSRILVSINSDNTVRISEGISIATQTPRDRKDTITETKAENVPNIKDTHIQDAKEDKSVQTTDEVEDIKERNVCTNNGYSIIPQLHLKDDKPESDDDDENKIREEQHGKHIDILSRKEAPESENETDFWTDTGVQTDDELTNYGLRIAWDSKSVEALEGAPKGLKQDIMKENVDVETHTKIASPVSVESANQSKSFEQNMTVLQKTEHNRTDEFLDSHIPSSVECLPEESKDADYSTNKVMEKSTYLELNESKPESQTSTTENKNEGEESNRVPEHNLARPVRSFDMLSLEKYGKYKVRLSSDNEKCIVSSAAFLETGDAILIDRSNQKVKFVDKTFQFISSYELPAKPWAICAKGQDIYVTMGNTKIQHLVIDDMIIEPVKTFEIKGRCLGICVLNGYIAVGLQVGEVYLLDSDGKKQGTIQLPTIEDKPCNPWHLAATSEDNILVTDSDACSLFCINQKSELIFTFKQLGSPRGTAVDSEGHILIVGRDKETGAVVSIVHKDEELSHMLHIEKKTEIKCRILMTWEQLEFVPYCVSFRKDRVVVLGGIQESLKIMTL